jgi:hypothetical protein
LEAKNVLPGTNNTYNGNPYAYHIETELSLLNELPKVPNIDGPKFVFAHLVLTHGPYVFLPNGSITNDPRFFGDELNPITPEYDRLGYLNQIQFTNNQILAIVSEIIKISKIPPIIIIQGDHGFQGDNRSENLNAYYVNDATKKSLYPTITPVNSFRLIFDHYFNTNYGLLPDKSFTRASPGTPVPETSPDCVQYYK